jgi:putative Holliday junction resolvase
VEKRIIALDVGDRRIGVAVSDLLGITAQPVETYTRVGYGPDIRHMAALAQQYETAQFLCGLPRNMDGTQGGQAQKVRDFAQQLEKAGFSVCYWDERLTTVTAERALLLANMSREGRREKIDMVAAVVILQAFLDAGGMKNLKKDEDHQMDEQKRNNPMDEEMDEENVVELVDEDGQSVRFEHLMTIEHEGDLYVMLTALEATPDTDEDEVFILRIEKDDQGEDCYVTVEDEDVLQAVFEKFVALSEQDDDPEQ